MRRVYAANIADVACRPDLLLIQVLLPDLEWWRPLTAGGSVGACPGSDPTPWGRVHGPDDARSRPTRHGVGRFDGPRAPISPPQPAEHTHAFLDTTTPRLRSRLRPREFVRL